MRAEARARAEKLDLPRNDEVAEARELCTESFAEFMRRAWPVLERRKLIWGWHNDAMVDHLEAVTKGHIRKLIISVPPAASKTMTVGVMWPAWEWICNQHEPQRLPPDELEDDDDLEGDQAELDEDLDDEGEDDRHGIIVDGFRPDLRYIAATYSDKLTRDKSLICRKLVSSSWYRSLFGDRWQRDRDVWSTTKFGNRLGGWRLATSIGSQATGQHADRKILDDPVKPQDVYEATAHSERGALEAAWRFWTQTMGSRETGPDAVEVIIMQRLHDLDVVGRCIKELKGYEVLCIPQEYERKHPIAKPTVIERDHNLEPVKTWTDPRKKEGELMCPRRFPRHKVEESKLRLGPLGYAAQQQQRPAPAGGAIYKREYYRYWTVRPREGVFVISVDCAFKDLQRSDFVSMQVWCANMPNFYLLDRVHDRLDVKATCDALAVLRAGWPQVTRVLIEDKANGPAVASLMKGTIPGLELVTPMGGKVARANATVAFHASGNVWLPDPKLAPWVNEYIAEHVTFPFGANDDDVDAQSQAITNLAKHMADYEKMLETMRQMGIDVG